MLLLVLFCMILCLLVIAAFIVASIRRKRFAYDVSRDYEYGQLPKSATVSLREGELILPDTIGANDTVIARINVKSGWLGRLVMPWIGVKTNRGEWRAYVEHGGNGARYLNLTDTFDDSSRKITLSGNRVFLPDQEVELSVYPRECLSGKKILVLAPHADDAELAAYGLYEKHAADTLVVTITAGEGGSFHYNNLYARNPEQMQAQYLQKGRMRVWNSLTVPLLAGVSSENILQLGYFDSTLQVMKQNPDADVKSTKLDTADVNLFRRANTSPLSKGLNGGSNWRGLVNNLAYIIETFQPDIIVSPSPNIDAHKDHQYTTIAAVEALKQLDYRKGSLFLHTLHFLSDDFPIGKSGSMLSLPPMFGQPFHFHSVYSLPLNKEEQNRKLLALDAMNDIRPNANWYADWKTMIFRGLNGLRHHVFDIDRDLVNRFVRSNELFYVVPVSDVHQEDSYQKIVQCG